MTDDTRLQDILRVLERIGYYADAYTLHEVAQELAELRRLRAAAQSWWENKRPCSWSAQQHVGNPTVNCAVPSDHELALAVAAMVAKENGR